ncbi:hypothetical protein KH5_09070 [Urechidicola sp. KH5]
MKTTTHFKKILSTGLLLLSFVTIISQTTIDNENFNTGWGIWNDGGGDCFRVDGNGPNGSWSINLQDNSGNASAMTSNNIDISSYIAIDFTFDFRAVGMETGDDFWIRYFDGATWHTVAALSSGTDFNNDTNYTRTVSLNASSYVFSPNARFRIQCDAGTNNDDIYLDNIHIKGYTLSANPEIIVSGLGNEIVGDGSNSPDASNNTEFGMHAVLGMPITHTFSIANFGAPDLNLTGGAPYVTISGDIADFTLSSVPNAAIPSVNTTTFDISFNPTATGLRSAVVTILNNDPDESSYTFNISGSGALIEAGGVWSYLDDGSNQGTAWYDPTFDYSSWATGNAELGYGDGDEVTTVFDGRINDPNSRTTYYRKSFTVSATDAANATLVMNAIRDDGMVVYIDGNQVWSNNMPATFDYDTDATGTVAGGDESTWVSKKIINPFTAPGTYEIGVEIHQVTGTSSDTSFNFEMFTNNDYVFVPPAAPDVDNDGVADFIDSDDDNDGVPDIVEGCYTSNFEGLNSTGVTSNEETITGTINGNSLTMDDGNILNFSTVGAFNRITSYFAGEHGWAVRVHGPGTLGTLTFDFQDDVEGLFFKLVDFDENERWTVNVYDSSNNLIDLTTSNNIYKIGSYITQTGNTFYDHYYGTAGNNNGDAVLSDDFGSVYFYFPSTAISRIEFVVDQPDSSTIRIAAMHYCGLDTDGDGVDDYYDSDSDNDGIPDLVEAGGVDTDGNGIIDVLTDTDADGLPDAYDITPNVYFAEEITTLYDDDFDRDGLKSRIDLDSDNDGILDIIEAMGEDTDANGMLDAFVDINSDGYHDAFDGPSALMITGADTDADGVPNVYPTGDIDGTGRPNFMDIDSDDDGITDNTEAQATGSYINPANSDADSGGTTDGIDDNYDSDNVNFGGSGIIPVDTDYDGIPDYLDTNSDENEEDDIIEGHDSDGDGVADAGSNSNSGVPNGADSDGDGLDDGFDNNTSVFDPTNNGLNPDSHPIVDGGTDRDWRYTVIYLDFDGINDHIDFGDSHRIESVYSFEAWVMQEVSPALEYGTIISKGDVNAGSLRGYHMGVRSDNRPEVVWYNASGNTVLNLISPYAINNNRWYHFAFVYNGSDAILYIDGVEVNRVTPSELPYVGTEKSIIGAIYDSSTPSAPKNFFNGAIDEVRFWKYALSPEQIRQMMNQEIMQSGSNVRGVVVPENIKGGIQWSDSDGYYNMNGDNAQDLSSNTFNGIPRNTTTLMPQTAPIPYTTIRDGNWEDTSATTPWTYGDTVWDAPNSLSIDGVTKIDWNIVSSSHNVVANTDVKVLGFISNSIVSDVTEENITDSNLIVGQDGNDYQLNISRYLKLDGKIDLKNESQLIQGPESILDLDSSGYIERDQQGTQNSFTYNYWSSPVASRSTTVNNGSFTVEEVLRDGSDPENPNTIVFEPTGSDPYFADGALTSPRRIATYWLWKFVNQGSAYANWQHIGHNNTLNPTEGFTMKGTSGASGITTEQNYVFRGKPNNAPEGRDLIHTTFSVPSDPNNPYISLVGNPFPSAIDANQFINDNATSTTQTLYFWEHWGGGNHILDEYEGGYSTYTKAGSVPTPSLAASHPDVSQIGIGSKLPGQYISVAQGFYVQGSAAGGDVIFKNSQRVYQTEEGNPNSIFTRTSGIPKIRLGFDLPNHIHRQIMISFIDGASDSYDTGYDARPAQVMDNDVMFIQEDKRQVIQAFNSFIDEREIPLTVIVGEAYDQGTVKFMIDSLEQIDSSINIFLKDNESNQYFDLREGVAELTIPSGEIKNRFSIVFRSQTLSTSENTLNDLLRVFMNRKQNHIEIYNNGTVGVKEMEIFNILGQKVYHWQPESEVYDNQNIDVTELETGAYIVSLSTAIGRISKKIIKK